MSTKLDRVILEMGSGVSLHGTDYTKAACRAVEDAIHHSSLSFMRELGMDPDAEMTVEVTIGVQDPSAVDVKAVAAMLPHGNATVRVVKGGLNVRIRNDHRQRGGRGIRRYGAVPGVLTANRNLGCALPPI